MSWVTILLLILKYGPAIYQLVKEIIELIRKIQTHMPQTESALFEFSSKKRLDMAVKYYKITGDKIRLEELHGELTVQLRNLGG